MELHLSLSYLKFNSAGSTGEKLCMNDNNLDFFSEEYCVGQSAEVHPFHTDAGEVTFFVTKS